MSDLQARLLAAHECGDSNALVTLYREAADTANDSDAEGFFLTHAYIFALETGHSDARELHKRLKDAGREE